MLQSAFHIFPARVDSYRPKNDIEVFRKLWACARFLSTSFANNLLYWFGSWTSHAKTLLRQFPMPLRPLPKLPGPVASRGSLLFFLMMELSKMHTFYKQPGTCFTEANCFFHNMPVGQPFFHNMPGVWSDDDYLCVCNISGFLAGKCTAPLVWALWIILLPVLIHMEWVAVDNPLEFWFKSVSRVHQGTIINWIFNCLKVTSVMIFTRSWQLRTECHSGPFRQVYFCLLGMFWPWVWEQFHQGLLSCLSFARYSLDAFVQVVTRAVSKVTLRQVRTMAGKTHTHLGWDVLKQVTRTQVLKKSMNDNATMNDNEKRMEYGREDLFPNCPHSASKFAFNITPGVASCRPCTKLCHTYCISLCFLSCWAGKLML